MHVLYPTAAKLVCPHDFQKQPPPMWSPKTLLSPVVFKTRTGKQRTPNATAVSYTTRHFWADFQIVSSHNRQCSVGGASYRLLWT